jgi:hypothetical protein
MVPDLQNRRAALTQSTQRENDSACEENEASDGAQQTRPIQGKGRYSSHMKHGNGKYCDEVLHSEGLEWLYTLWTIKVDRDMQFDF